MDGRGGCCIERYAGGHAAAYDMSKMDKIMLRFRPIAPKPIANGEAPSKDGGSNCRNNNNSKAVATTRGRRRGNSSGSTSSSSKKCTNSNHGNKRRKSCSPDRTVTQTLALLPEAPDLSPRGQENTQGRPMWINFANDNNTPGVGSNYRQGQHVVDLAPPRQQKVVGSCVTVEAITDTWREGIAVRKGLDEDTCPGFITDVWNRVWWTNEAYRRMVMGEDTWRDQKMVVWVVMREKVPDTLQAFTCRVRVQQSYDGKEVRGSALTLPCDVWRIDGGGFAWRLDVEAALSLGR